MNNKDSFRDFLYWEKASRDTIDFKKIYVDMTGDLLAGLLLSQIVYWHLPNKSGDSKLRIEKNGYYWIAKSHDEWYEEIRFSRKNFDTASKKLVQQKIIEKQIFKFSGTPTIHIRLIEENFLNLWINEIENLKKLDLEKNSKPLIHMDLSESDKSEKPAPDMDLSDSDKWKCPIRANGNARFGQMEMPDSGKSLTESTTKNISKNLKRIEDEEEVNNTSRLSNFKIFQYFSNQNNGSYMLTPIQSSFLANLMEYDINDSMGMNILKEIGDLNQYSSDALNRTFKKGMSKVRLSKEIKNFPRWFATTLHNEEFQHQQDENQRLEMKKLDERIMRWGKKEENPAQLVYMPAKKVTSERKR